MLFSSSYVIKAIDQFTPTANRVSQGFDKISRKADIASGSASRFSQALRRISTAQAIVMSSIGYFAARALVSFSEQFQGVKSVADETSVSFKQLEVQAKELGRTTRYTASEAAAAQYFLAKAGYDTQQIYDSMPSTLLLASAANLDIAQSADIVTNIMAGYDMTAQELTQAVDILTKAFSSANMDLVELGVSMKYAGPVAHGMGIDFKEAAAAIGMMGKVGVKGSMAGTSLRQALSRLSAPTGRVAKIIRKLKLDLYDSKGNLKSFTNIIQQLEQKSVTASQMMLLFGQRAGPAMIGLVSQGSEALQEYINKLEQAEGFAQRAADIRLEGLYGTWIKLKSAAEGFVHALGDAGLTNLLVGLGQALTFILNLFSKILNVISQISEFLGGKIGEGIGWLLAKAERFGLIGGTTRPDNAHITDIQKAILDEAENQKRLDAIRSEIQMQIQINDKNNNVGNISASAKGSNLGLNVGKSSRGS